MFLRSLLYHAALCCSSCNSVDKGRKKDSHVCSKLATATIVSECTHSNRLTLVSLWLLVFLEQQHQLQLKHSVQQSWTWWDPWSKNKRKDYGWIFCLFISPDLSALSWISVTTKPGQMVVIWMFGSSNLKQSKKAKNEIRLQTETGEESSNRLLHSLLLHIVFFLE